MAQSDGDLIAADVVKAVNAATYSGRWPKLDAKQTTRHHAPKLDVRDLSEVVIAIYPSGRAREPFTRSRSITTWSIAVAVMQHVGRLTLEDQDDIRHLAEEIDEKLEFKSQAGLSWIGSEWQIVNQDWLERFSVYASIVTAQYRG